MRFPRWSWLAAVLAGWWCIGGPLPAADPSAGFEGRPLRNVNPDDARVLGILLRGLTYQTQKDGRMTPELQKQVAAATEAYIKQDLNTAYRLATRLVMRLRGQEVSEESEVAASFDFRLGQKIVAPGEALPFRLEPWFTLGRQPAGRYSARLTLRSTAGQQLETLAVAPIAEFSDTASALPIGKLAPGKYLIHYELFSPEGKLLVELPREFLVSADLTPRLAALNRQLERIQAGRLAAKGPQHRAAVETIEYLAGLLGRARHEYVADMNKKSSPMTTRLRGLNLTASASDPFHPDKDLPLAEELAAALLAGKNPLAARAGDLRLAYRSAVDNTLQPFRVFVPSGFDPSRKYPLIIALHGATGDENSYLDRYLNRPGGENLFKKLGQERGYILAAPNGRGPYGGYAGNAEKDVLDVMDRLLEIYPIRREEVFLTGHSMGGGGTWAIGFRHPRRFAALAPVASGFGGRAPSSAALPLENAPHMPVLYCQGLKDTLATPETGRQVREIAGKALPNFRYLEFPDDHFVVGVTSMPAVFDFFDAQRASRKSTE